MPYPNHPSAKESLSNASVGSRPNLESAVAIAKHLDLVEPQLETGRINPPELAAELRDLSQITLTERAAPVMFPELLPRLKELHTELNSLEPPPGGASQSDLAKSGPIAARMSVLASANALVILRSEAPEVDLSGISALVKEAFGDLPPPGIKQIVVVQGLGIWKHPSGGPPTPIPARLTDAEGAVYVDAALLSDPARMVRVLHRVGELATRLAYEQHGADSSIASMQRTVVKMAGFEPSDSASPYGYLTHAGDRYRVCLGGATTFDRSIYPAFQIEGDGLQRKAVIIDSQRDHALQRMYAEFDAVIAGLPSLPGSVELLALASAFVDTKVRNKAEDAIALPQDSHVYLGEYYAAGGGECRQKALLLGCLTEHLRNTKRFDGAVTLHASYSYRVADAHAYLEYESPDHTVYFADPTHHRFVPLDYDEPPISGDGGTWPYRSHAQIAALRGLPVWCP